MTIREKVARAIAWRKLTDTGRKECVWPVDFGESEVEEYQGIAATAITTFLEAAAEQGWHMRPDEATQRMQTRGMSEETPNWPAQSWRVMSEVAPEFEWDK